MANIKLTPSEMVERVYLALYGHGEKKPCDNCGFFADQFHLHHTNNPGELFCKPCYVSVVIQSLIEEMEEKDKEKKPWLKKLMDRTLFGWDW
jgi:hypothetical protein